MKKNIYFITILLMLFLCQDLVAQQRTFTARYNNTSVRGGIKFISNSIVTSFTNADPYAPRNEVPPLGTSDNNVATAVGRNIDVDADAATFNSSTADLSLASCSNILFAGLYWTAGWGQNAISTWITGQTTCKLKLPGSATYTTITSTQNDIITPVLVPAANYTSYQCFANITTMVAALANPNGTYAVADVVSPALSRLGVTPSPDTRTNLSGGWTIVIVYGNPSLLPRSLTVFDGYAAVNGGSNTDVVINGFLTPPGGPVSCELGMVATDGDRGTDANSQDGFQFRQGVAGGFVDLALTAEVPMSGNADMWNSSITHKGAIVATRNPAYQNTMGYDADVIDLPNIGNARLGNSQTTATVRFTTPSESYTVGVLTTSISIYNPSFSFEKIATDVNGGSLNPGDILQYQVNYNNVGNDASTSSIIRDNIPTGTAYIAGSLRINGVAKTDVAGDDEAEYDFTNNRVVFRIGTGATSAAGGTVASGSTGNVQFSVATPSSCKVATCTGPIRNSARIDYRGQTSSDILNDSTGVTISGCLIDGPVISTLTAACYDPLDTLLENTCPVLSKTLPVAKYAGYTFYNSTNFIPANIINPYTPITSTRVVFAYYNSGVGCADTIQINIYINGCPDIDDDNDGLPDYLELKNPTAIADQDSDGRPNWADNSPGAPIVWVDNNLDNVNDWYDPGADADNDGIPNFYDINFPGYVDNDGDGVNDNMDTDLDGIPDFLDVDSDNDGIPDTAESFGVDANGDGRIDNFSDSDADGLSDNVDATISGGQFLRLSGLGLGALDTDLDGIANYLDLDSDNDGIPDIIEAFGTDASNSAKVSVYGDVDGDGYADVLDGDVGNDAVAENSSSSILRTGVDGNNDGRADSYPYKNMDADSKASPYDLDSDGDGVSDVKEAGFADTDWDGRIDGALNTNGRNTAQAALPSLTLPNTDGVGRTNPYDIDSDEDGIPDNVEGLTTLGYILPAYADADGDGLDNAYDNFSGFGGDGIHPCDIDGDTVPDYLDSDTDGDGLIDRVEGNDLNFNALPDDNVTLTGVDTDGDGLDDRFDNNNSSSKATSRYMGTGGTTSGENPPGSITTVQHSAIAAMGCPTERDWRCVFYILNCDIITFKAVIQDQQTRLDWTVLCEQEVAYFIVERSTDGVNFSQADMIPGRAVVNAAESYTTTDEIGLVTADVIYYRLRTVSKTGRMKLSNVITLHRNKKATTEVHLLPNPVRSQLQLLINTGVVSVAKIYIMDGMGKVVQNYTENVVNGTNTFAYNQAGNLSAGVYYLRLVIGNEILTKKFNVIK